MKMGKKLDLNVLITRVENKWLDMLYNESMRQFSSVKIHSHDHLHHLRVWEFSKELLREIHAYGIGITKSDIEKLIVAAFFHDMGLVKTTDVKHGLESKKICESFFRQRRISMPDFAEVLFAIEHHDDKEYKSRIYKRGERRLDDTLSMLCVSDDLDAFGAIGVFRYAEIYILREVKIGQLPTDVLTNLDARFKNLKLLYNNFSAFINRHKKRYEFTGRYYKKLFSEFNKVSYSSLTDVGAIGVLNIIIREIMEKNKTILQLDGKFINNKTDKYIAGFFKQFKSEVDRFHALV
jgi:HD superfamily phosphodiesterase